MKMLSLVMISTIFLSVIHKGNMECAKIPDGITSPSSVQDPVRYEIEISGNPDSYIPGEQYTIYLRSKTQNQDESNKFIRFVLYIENSTEDVSKSNVGALQLYGDSLTKMSENCPNMVIESDLQPKFEIQVLWVAPTSKTGCVNFKAIVVETPKLWFNEHGALSKTLCSEVEDEGDSQPIILRHCCACDEAKYEVTFEGLWSRNTHPKDFPPNGYADVASEGLRQLAENGNTRMLESELKAKSDQIRTIIKARGISYPNMTGKTFAVFRVDNRHHLMSIVSMIDPSPDWIVGVSALELCLRNCSWMESQTVNLYPWDVGTDDGITYISPNQPSVPRQRIRRLRQNSQNDPRSPFYDITGNRMKPFARLYLSRQRLYEKACDTTFVDEGEDDVSNCETEAWSEWSPCSATCGRGVKYKQRRYKQEESKYICHKKLTERAVCEAARKYCPHKHAYKNDDPLCSLEPWGEWSGCSVTCGKGVKMRSRRYKSRIATKICMSGKTKTPKLQQNMECVVSEKCDDEDVEMMDVKCPNHIWSDWSPCSVTCGRGFRVRYKLSLERNKKDQMTWPFRLTSPNFWKEHEEIYDDDPCNNLPNKETVECYESPCEENSDFLENAEVCMLPKDVGACKSNLDRWYFDRTKGNCEIFSYSGCEGNLNNFKTLERCQSLCLAGFQKNLKANQSEMAMYVSGDIAKSYPYPVNIQSDAIKGISILENNTKMIIPCSASDWTKWSPCYISDSSCGHGFKYKLRHIEIPPFNGGKSCPNRLIRRKDCHVSCIDDSKKNVKKFDNKACILTEWSPWTHCTKPCQFGSFQMRYKYVLVEPTDGSSCENLVERRLCDCS